MKIALLLLLVIVAAYGAIKVIGRRGDEATLDTMRLIRHGASKDEVRKIFGRDPQIVPANTIPDWIREVAPEKEKGEYWYFFMGYPPRNIIIYFDESNSAIFATWQNT